MYVVQWPMSGRFSFLTMEKIIINRLKTGLLIQRAREVSLISVDSLSIKIKVRKETVINWEKGLCVPTLINLISISNILQIPMQKLVAFELIQK